MWDWDFESKGKRRVMDSYKFMDEVTHGWHAHRPKAPERMKPKRKAFAIAATVLAAAAIDVSYIGAAQAASAHVATMAPDTSAFIAAAWSNVVIQANLFWDILDGYYRSLGLPTNK
jgi:tryptophan 2,3-dioxygenase